MRAVISLLLPGSAAKHQLTNLVDRRDRAAAGEPHYQVSPHTRSQHKSFEGGKEKKFFAEEVGAQQTQLHR